MIRLGIVDFDTSHAVEFTKRLNHIAIAEDHWVEGAKIVAGVPGRSAIAPEVIPKNLETLKGYGITLFVDKPFACSLADARAMVKPAMEKHIPLMSCSSLRYAPDVVAAQDGKGPAGKIIGVSTYGPSPTHPRNPGLFHYGIHPVEMLFTLMGQGCRKVSSISEPGGEVVTGVWADGRIGSVRGIRDGMHDYGFTIVGDKAVQNLTVNTKYIYREMLKKIVAMFETRQLPIDLRETLEIVAFIEAARQSAEGGGAPVAIKV
jgi:predicted dehydrogenase